MYIKIDNQQIYYQKVGRGKNLVLLHGYNQDSSSFWNIVNPLKEHYTLWLLDLPGFGRSDPPKKNFKVGDYAEIIYKFIKKQNIKKTAVLGHSLGGRIAIKLASKNFKEVEKIILESSAGIRIKHRLKDYLLYLMAKVIKFFVPNVFNLKKILRHKFYSLIGSDYGDVKEKMRQTFLNVIEEDLSRDMKIIEVPTLLIWGEKDTQVPVASGKIIYHLIKNSKLVVLENTGHLPHMESPNLFTYYVKDFI